MTTALLALMFGLPCQPPPSEPLQQYAFAIVQGTKGNVTKEQLHIANYIIANDLKAQGTAWITKYGPPKFPRGATTASGAGCSERTASVCINDFKKRKGMFIWTRAYGIRVVQDCGANFNTRHAKSRGANIWLDWWDAKPHGSKNPVTPYAFIPRKAGR